MNDFKKPERIVVDESILEDLFGSPARKLTPAVEPAAATKRPSDAPAPSKSSLPAPEQRIPPKEPAPMPAQVPDEVVAGGGGKPFYDSESLLNRALMPDAGRNSNSTQIGSRPAAPAKAEPALSVRPAPAAPSRPAAATPPVPAARPDDPEWQHTKGNQQYARGDLSGAEESYRRVLELDPESWSAHLNLGIVLEQVSRHKEALAEYKEAWRIDGSRVEPALRSGYVELRLGEYEAALASFTSALELEARNSRALFGKGCALQFLEKFGEAGDCYKTVLGDHPESEELLSNVAAASVALNDYPRALEYIGRMANRVEEPEHRLRLQIECAVAAGDEEAVAQHSAQLVEVLEDSYEAWFNLGVACQHTGRLEVAVDAYKQALAVEPDRAEAQVNLGAVLHESENLVEARQFYEAALGSGCADHPGVNWNLGLAAESMGGFDVAEKAYAAVVHSQPQWKEAVGRLTRLNPAHDAAR